MSQRTRRAARQRLIRQAGQVEPCTCRPADPLMQFLTPAAGTVEYHGRYFSETALDTMWFTVSCCGDDFRGGYEICIWLTADEQLSRRRWQSFGVGRFSIGYPVENFWGWPLVAYGSGGVVLRWRMPLSLRPPTYYTPEKRADWLRRLLADVPEAARGAASMLLEPVLDQLDRRYHTNYDRRLYITRPGELPSPELEPFYGVIQLDQPYKYVLCLMLAWALVLRELQPKDAPSDHEPLDVQLMLDGLIDWLDPCGSAPDTEYRAAVHAAFSGRLSVIQDAVRQYISTVTELTESGAVT